MCKSVLRGGGQQLQSAVPLFSPQHHEGGVMEKLNPAALAERYEERGADPADIRNGVQSVDEDMIRAYVVETGALPIESARPFADWLDGMWDEYAAPDDDKQTNGDVIEGALAFWRGQ